MAAQPDSVTMPDRSSSSGQITELRNSVILPESSCPLRPDGRCELTGLAPLLCPGHGGELSTSDKAINPQPCPPCQERGWDWINAVLGGYQAPPP